MSDRPTFWVMYPSTMKKLQELLWEIKTAHPVQRNESCQKYWQRLASELCDELEIYED